MAQKSEKSRQQLIKEIKKLQKKNKELQGWKEKYLSLEKTSPEAVTITDLEGRITGLSKQTLKLHGAQKAETLIGKNAFELIAPEYHEIAAKNMERVAKGERIHGVEYEMIKMDGTRFMGELSAALIKDPQGQPAAFIATTRDVTQKKEADRILKESEERYRSFFENLPIGIYRTTPEGKILEANPALVEMLAFPSLDTLLKKKASDLFITPGNRQEELDYVNTKGVVRGYDIRMRRYDGSVIWARDTVRAIKDNNRRLLYYEGSLEDITSQKTLEKTLQESEEFLTNVFESIQDGISILDRDLTIQRVNGVMNKWYEEYLPLEGKKCYAVYQNRKKPCIPCPTFRCLESGHIEKDTVPGPKGSDIKWIELFSYPIKDPETDEVSGAVEFVRDITDRVEAEQALRESEEKYRSLADNLNVGVYRNTAGPRGKFIEANPAITKMFGYRSKKDFLSRNVSSLYQNPRDRKKFNDKIQQDGFVKDEELILKKKDGKTFFASVSAVAVKDDKGKVLFYDGVIEDISERKKIEKSLRENEEKYSALFHQSTDAVFIHRLDGTIIDVNQKVLDLFGYSRKQILSLKIPQLHPKDMLETSRRAFQTVGRMGEVNFECYFKKKNGELFPAEVSANLFELRGKKLIQGIVRDITERKQAEDALRESEHRYRTTLDSMRDAIHVVNRDLCIQLFNKTFQQWNQDLGLEREVIGKNLFEVFPFLPGSIKKEYEKVVRTGNPLSTFEETEIAGQVLLTETTKIPITEDGKVIKIITVIHDITERRRTEEMQEAVYEISEATSAAEDLHSLFGSIHQIVSELMPAKDNFYIALYDESSGLLSFPYFVDEYDDIPEPKKMGRGLTEYVFRTGKPQLIPPERFKKLEKSGDVESIGAPSIDWLGVPLKTKGKVFGVLTVQSYTEGLRYDEKDKEILTFISEQVSMAIERKRAEEALRESERRYHSLFDRSLTCVYVHDFKGNFIDANDGSLRLLGYEKEDLVSLNFGSLLTEDQIPQAFKMMEEIIQLGHQKTPVQYKLRKKDGNFVWVETEGSLIYRKGKAYAIQGIARDITEQKRFQEALRESEEKYRAIFESFHDVYYRTNRQGEVVLISPSVESQAGFKPEEVVGRPVSDFYKDPSERDEFEQALRKNGYINDYELQLLAKDGRIIEVSTSSKMIFDDEDHVIGIEGVLRDITARKKAEQQVKASLEEKEVLLKEIHHRVKNNMQIISSLLNLQCSRIKNPDVIDMFKESRDRIRAMALIHEKLYLSKDLAKIDFSQYIKGLAVHLYHVYKVDSGAIRLNSQVENVYLDINRAIPCGLIINELLSNALKHAFPGDSQGEINLSLSSPKAGRYILSISDTGIGIPEKTDPEKPESLGLQLVNDLVAQLGGKIDVDVQDGSTFRIEF